jgi:hypothetical protein
VPGRRQQVVVDVDHAANGTLEAPLDDGLRGRIVEIGVEPAREQGSQRLDVGRDQQQLPRRQVPIDRHRLIAAILRST